MRAHLPRTVVFTALALAAAGPARAQSAGTVIMLGADTVAVERFTRTADRLEGEVVSRMPQVTVRRYVVEMGPGGRARRAEVSLWRPGASAAYQTSVATFTTDSIMVEVRRDTAVQRRRIGLAGAVMAVPAGPNTSWAITEFMADRRRAARSDSVHVPGYFVGAAGGLWFSWTFLGRDSVRIRDSGGGMWMGRLDREGRLVSTTPLAGTQLFAGRRIPAPDVGAIASAWRARETQAGAAGLASPRDTVRAAVAGATLMVDYGRPAKRGRVIFGTPVAPFGAVWRTGANAATQFRTDRALEMGGVVVPAGFYTLWTIPSADGWKLLINAQTGQWGTAHDPARDIFQLDMRVTRLTEPVERFTIRVSPDGQGGVLHLEWDATRASIPFTVR